MTKQANTPCSISVDLDNQWSYMKTHGDSGWDEFPSYLDVFVPRLLEILDDLSWRITVFVVGQDADLDRNHEALSRISSAGHDIGNHSFNHEPWLHLYSKQQITDEIARAEEAIASATGTIPTGFRGPGYSLSLSTLQVLSARGYDFDASTFPTYLGPLARAYYFMTSEFTAEEKERRKQLFGGIREGLRPLRPYLWCLDGGEILEIPVTTTPVFKTPFHFSYLLYIATYSPALARAYFAFALKLCLISGTQPSLLLHPLDFLGADDVPELGFFPAMKLPGDQKRELLVEFFHMVNSCLRVLTVAQHAELARRAPRLATRTPRETAAGRTV